jgi:hypothetical protein
LKFREHTPEFCAMIRRVRGMEEHDGTQSSSPRRVQRYVPAVPTAIAVWVLP